MLTPAHSQFAQQAPSQKAGIMPFTTVFCIFRNVGLEETINLAKNAVPATRRVNSKPL
ncbi:phage tail protein, partial [Salmonella enterica]|nr:phage tail protein [Salmonella enterica subsp. enterica serovar Oslo]ECH2728381.1 phage tail protein [Salmonella enterica]EEC3366819.1 phage tail protein [Salmonella enterica subsp. enterica serovar Oslo]